MGLRRDRVWFIVGCLIVIISLATLTAANIVYTRRSTRAILHRIEEISANQSASNTNISSLSLAAEADQRTLATVQNELSSILLQLKGNSNERATSFESRF